MVFQGKGIAGVLGALLFFLGLVLLIPMLVGIIYADGTWESFAATAVGSLAVGGACWRFFKPDREFRIREGFVIVALAWLLLSLVGALPFVLSGTLHSYTDAFFETMSGFTTTGATILSGPTTPAIEDIPHSLLLWRSLTHWIGGMGIIVLTLAVLPMLGVGGMQLFKAEVPGPSADKFTPRVKETAKRLWLIYIGITGLEILMLLPVMNLFDAVNHSFATMATGGFSTRNGSVADYGSAYVDWVIIFFMFVAGMNFVLHYRMLKGDTLTVFKDEEFRLYTLITVGAIALVSISLYTPLGLPIVTGISPEGGAISGYNSIWDAIRYGAFQVVSIITTTGFGTADYEIWPPLAIGVIFGLFFAGSMAGSTGGGIKTIRHLLLIKNTLKEFRQLVHPQAVLPVRLNGRVVSPDVMRNVLTFFVLYIAMTGVGTLIMAALGLDIVSGLGAVLSCLGNIGPGFGSFGPTETYTHVSDTGKWALALFMMAGRLEIFTVLVILLPAFWRR